MNANPSGICIPLTKEDLDYINLPMDKWDKPRLLANLDILMMDKYHIIEGERRFGTDYGDFKKHTWEQIAEVEKYLSK